MVYFSRQAVGIDMAKDKFDVCFSLIDNLQQITVKSTRKFANTAKGFAEFDAWLAKWTHKQLPLTIVVEATGVYHEQLCQYLHHQGLPMAVVLPNKGKKYAQALGIKSKNDQIDAKGLARMGAEQALPLWQPFSEKFYQLRTLTRERERLQHMKTMFANQLHALEHSCRQSQSTRERIDQQLGLFATQLQAIDQEISHIVDQDPELKQRIERILQVKGLGFISVVTVLAECNGFALFDNQRQVVSFAGYDVVENQSGQRTGKSHISKKGNSHIRRVLHMPAFSAVSHDERFTAFFQRLMSHGKTKMQAYVAVQRKLLVLIYALWNNEEAYRPTVEKMKPQVEEGKDTCGIHEPKPLLSVASAGGKKQVAPTKARATQDELACNQSPEALLSVRLK